MVLLRDSLIEGKHVGADMLPILSGVRATLSLKVQGRVLRRKHHLRFVWRKPTSKAGFM